MVTFDEELVRSITDAKTTQDYADDVDEVIEWYAILIARAFASTDTELEPFIEELQSQWEDFENADNPARLASEKHGFR